MASRYKIFLIVGIVTFLADQLSKLAARAWLAFDERLGGKAVAVIEGYFDWRLSYNTGSAFGLFGRLPGARIWLTVVGIAAVIAIVLLLRQARDDQRRYTWALGLVAGGAVGNVLDRILFGRVTDFIVWKWHQHEWPTFNIADAALVIGVGLLFLDLRGPNPSDDGKAAADGAGEKSPGNKGRLGAGKKPGKAAASE